MKSLMCSGSKVLSCLLDRSSKNWKKFSRRSMMLSSPMNKHWKKSQASHCCTADVYPCWPVNQLYNNWKMDNNLCLIHCLPMKIFLKTLGIITGAFRERLVGPKSLMSSSTSSSLFSCDWSFRLYLQVHFVCDPYQGLANRTSFVIVWLLYSLFKQGPTRRWEGAWFSS